MAGGEAAKRAKVTEQQASQAPSVAVSMAINSGKSSEPKLGVAPGKALTLEEIQRDKLTQIAAANWSVSGSDSQESKPAFSSDLVKEIYNSELKVVKGSKAVPLQRAMLLEISQYLERYLWPNFDQKTASFEHVMSIILMINEKFRENVPAFTGLHSREDVFPALFNRILILKEEHDFSIYEKINYVLFMINVFQSLENNMVRDQVLQLVGLPLWHALSPARLQRELRAQSSLMAVWQKLLKRDARARKSSMKTGEKVAPVSPLSRPQVKLIPSLLDEFLQILLSVVPEESGGAVNPEVDPASVLYCERFVEFLIDLLSQLPSRRFVVALVRDRSLVLKCRMSGLYSHILHGALFAQLTDLLNAYVDFPMEDHTGKQRSEEEVQRQHCARWQEMQRIAFKEVPKLRQLALANVGSVDKEASLLKHISKLTPEELHDFVCNKLALVPVSDVWSQKVDFLRAVVAHAFCRRPSQRDSLNSLPLYPNEALMWDDATIPALNYSGERCLALPKLNLQFLTLHDYLRRNFNLFRLESTYEIRGDVEEAVQRLQAAPAQSADADEDAVEFRGWSRMAVALQGFRVTEVKPPLLGETRPAAVLASVEYSVSRFPHAMRQEWDEVKEHDVLFLLRLVAPPPRPPRAQDAGDGSSAATSAYEALPKAVRLGVASLRGCEVVEVRDQAGVLMNDMTGRVKREEWKPPQGTGRTLTVALDTAQYQMDVEGGREQEGTRGFNVVLRRKAKENNFKAILESIRDLMNEAASGGLVLPPWLHDIFLGYGEPGSAYWRNLEEQGGGGGGGEAEGEGEQQQQVLRTVDFKDTFLDAEHLRDSFPGHSVHFVTADGGEDSNPQPPFRVTLPRQKQTREGEGAGAGGKKKTKKTGGKRKESTQERGAEEEEAEEEEAAEGGGAPVLLAEGYQPPEAGPYPEDIPKQNTVRFTAVQVGAILDGVQPGLSMVVGPPGTGKTDTAVQILHVLYHNFPGQRTLLITHSNQALNQLFEKIAERDVPGRYLLRLGMGESSLETEEVFSRQGRVNAMLARRLQLLARVEDLAASLALKADVAYTCETSAHFWLLHVLSRWEAFSASCQEAEAGGGGGGGGEDGPPPSLVKDKFPFTQFFKDAPGFKMTGTNYRADLRVARGCFRHLSTMFTELAECRAFELLKTTADRSNYLMTRQAKVVAMTCTHAALKRRDLVEALAFHYDAVLVEEGAQILEIETFVPLVLQRAVDGQSRLKRVVLIGDHHQLPPVVKNMAFQKYAHMDQSLFTRFVRLGIPHTELDAQGRARPTIALLYSWRYRALGDLRHVREGEEYQRANAGFRHTFQLVDVPDWLGRGESEPNPWFYQNLGEAEYIVSVFQYLRLLGYPADRISILTTYNGQKHLLRDVLNRRCSSHPLFGLPSKVTTVDRFQGSQNDIILLSLVRTKTVGHLRDVRRLVVAMSRARLGLYVFCRRSLFEQCFELQPTFRLLLEKPDRLALVLGEQTVPTQRREEEEVGPGAVHLVGGIEDMAAIVELRFQQWLTRQQAEATRGRTASAGVMTMLAHAQQQGFNSAALEGATSMEVDATTVDVPMAETDNAPTVVERIEDVRPSPVPPLLSAMLTHAQSQGFDAGTAEASGEKATVKIENEELVESVAAMLAHAESHGYKAGGVDEAGSSAVSVKMESVEDTSLNVDDAKPAES